MQDAFELHLTFGFLNLALTVNGNTNPHISGNQYFILIRNDRCQSFKNYAFSRRTRILFVRCRSLFATPVSKLLRRTQDFPNHFYVRSRKRQLQQFFRCDPSEVIRTRQYGFSGHEFAAVRMQCNFKMRVSVPDI